MANLRAVFANRDRLRAFPRGLDAALGGRKIRLAGLIGVMNVDPVSDASLNREDHMAGYGLVVLVLAVAIAVAGYFYLRND